MANMVKEYGPKKGKAVFYASRNAKKIKGVDPESMDATNYNTIPSTEVGPTDWNAVIPNNLSDNMKTKNAPPTAPPDSNCPSMDSIKAKSFGGVSLADFGFGRDAIKITPGGDPKPGPPSVLAWSAPYSFGPGGYGLEPKQVAGGLKASGFGSSGINGKDSSFSNDSVSGTDKISKLWK